MVRCLASATVLFAIPSLILAAEGPLPSREAAASLKLPPGFRATLFAGEPDVVQPMSITFDNRGRMWVLECRSYPSWLPDGSKAGNDTILIFEDVDGDGRFDRRTVFLNQGVNFSSVEYGFGGVFVTAIPNLIFIPDANGDDVPDGPPQILLDGFDLKAKHNVANGLTWGPDGWLYGCNGILSNSRIGKPGTPDNQRVPMNCGIWRYHPVRHEFEVVAHGTTNPWGLAFDSRGEAFLTNCVIEHVFHVVPGARFKRMFGQDFNPKTFELMQTCADHIHWAGGTWEGSRDATGKHGEAGGGHAHSGAMIYLGNQFPAEYHNNLFTLNIHGQRLNRDKLDWNDRGFVVAKHMKDFAPSSDPWFRGVCVKQGPDGIYFTDWSDTGECHNYEESTIHRDNGRIYKITYGDQRQKSVDLSLFSDSQLIDTLADPDGPRANTARRLLHERAAGGSLSKSVVTQLSTEFHVSESGAENTNRPAGLQALWTLHSIGELKSIVKQRSPTLLAPNDEIIRGWLVRLGLEEKTISPEVKNHFAEIARTDPSPYVRLQVASGLQRLTLDDRKEIALGLVSHPDQARDDNNLVLMMWYAIEPLIDQTDDEVLRLALATKIPKLRQFIARHLATRESPRFTAILRWLEERVDDTASQRDILTGLYAAIEGRRNIPPNAGWMAVATRYDMSSDPVIRETSLRISLVQGSLDAFHELVKVVRDQRAGGPRRERALADLVTTRRPAVADLLFDQLSDPSLRAASIRGLAGFDRNEVGGRLLELYPQLNDAEKLDAIGTLTARQMTAMSLVSAVDEGRIDKHDLSEFDIRQLQRFKEPKLKQLVNKHFGAKPTSAERTQQIAEMKRQVLAADTDANIESGRTIFQKNCASCHTLFGEGRAVGPDLTGAQRTDLDYVLINVMDPSALVGHAYRVTILELKDGRVINGIVKSEDSSTLTLQTANDRVVVAIQDIAERQQQSVSMMPEGLLNRLSIQDIRNLIGYLGSEVPQVFPQ